MPSLKLGGVDVAKLINDELVPQLGNAGVTLVKITQGARVTSTEGKALTRTNHSGTGIVSDYKDSQIDGTIVLKGDRKILLFPLTFSTDGSVFPVPNDEIIAESITYTVVNVDRDPAAATYECHVR